LWRSKRPVRNENYSHGNSVVGHRFFVRRESCKPGNARRFLLVASGGDLRALAVKLSDLSVLCSCLAAFDVWNRKYQCCRFQTTSQCYTQHRTIFKGKRTVLCAETVPAISAAYALKEMQARSLGNAACMLAMIHGDLKTLNCDKENYSIFHANCPWSR